MASIINALSSGTGGIVTAGDASGILQLQTANTAAVTIDGSQNVGIGTSSPTTKLTVNNASATDYVSLTTGGTVKGVLADEAGDLIIKSAASLLFQTNGSIRARLNTTGAFVLAGGTTTANGIGITFPATQSASSDANTLDDYEEGTWTPIIFGGSTSGSTTYVSQNGTYTKIGRVVYFNTDVDWSAQTGTGSLCLGGLPFTAGSTNGNCTYSSNNLTFGTNYYGSLAQVNASTTYINFYSTPISGGGLNVVSVDTSARIWISGFYLI